jgi:TRAP-type C4-dicarboxylate transport system substrate-binding protein
MSACISDRACIFLRACIYATVLAAVPARAAPGHVLRLATVAPDGSAWAREFRAFARDVEASTGGAVGIKWYFGGIAGEEPAVADRIARDQLDGVLSGGVLCQQLAPSLRVLNVLGLIHSREEAAYVAGRLLPALEEEFHGRGYTSLAVATVGPAVLFTREPVRSLADLRRLRVWFWEFEGMRMHLSEMGIPAVALPLERAGAAYDLGRVDGFLAVPQAALAFQWSAQARYVSDLRIALLVGCLVVANRAFDELPLEAQAALRAAGAKLRARVEEVGRAQDEALLGSLFARQGLRPMPVSDEFRSEFLQAARAARERLGERLVPLKLLARVVEMLADYRAENRERH